MRRNGIMLLVAVALAGCANFDPASKEATYDPDTKQLTLPQPCPDWSQSQTRNYGNYTHSNFGCSVNTNAAIQLENPSDLYRGHGDSAPDTEITTRVIERYRAGEIPEPLNPVQEP